MSDDGKNKIDAVIDEVLESKHVKQGGKLLFKKMLVLIKYTLVLTILGAVLLIIAVASGVEF